MAARFNFAVFCSGHPPKTSAADPLPTSVLKLVIDVIAPFIAKSFNRSLATGQFPRVFKAAFITPVIKKPGLDVADPGSYRPISNLAVISKLLERLVSAQLVRYLEISNLLPLHQSGFQLHRSTETTELGVLSDTLDCGDVAVLTLLDLSAAFDTVDCLLSMYIPLPRTETRKKNIRHH